MKPGAKQYKFINSETGYVIYYHTLKNGVPTDAAKEELEKVKAQVAIKNKIFLDTVYWQEVKDEEKN